MCEEASSPLHNVRTRSSIWRMFRDAADEDYLVARIAAKSSLQHQFCWSAQQAIEKYLKAILLLNGHSVVEYGHRLPEMFKKAESICGDLLPIMLCPPSNFPSFSEFSVRSGFIPFADFISRIDTLGDPNNRYRSFSVAFDFYDLNHLDQTCFFLRRVAFPLELEVMPGKSAREFLGDNRLIQLHTTFSFTKLPHVRSKSINMKAFRWRNFAFYFESASKTGKITKGFTAINSELYLGFTGASADLDAMRWIAKKALPKSLSKEVIRKASY